jgi:hypothetical protein
MQRQLRDAPGVVITVHMQRENDIREKRKPWNRGAIFASGWQSTSETKSFYYPTGSCNDFPIGRDVRGFEKHDLGGRIEPPKDWPPKELESVIDASEFSAVPEAYKAF